MSPRDGVHLRMLDGGVPPASRGLRGIPRTCRYRAPTGRVPAGTCVRHPACPRCDATLGYRETEVGAMVLHVDDPRFRFTVVT